MKITKGPNWQFYAVTAFVIYLCAANESLWPLFWYAVFWIVLVPVCILLHKWNEAEDAKMVRDFPHDPYIQAKYGKKKT